MEWFSAHAAKIAEGRRKTSAIKHGHGSPDDSSMRLFTVAVGRAPAIRSTQRSLKTRVWALRPWLGWRVSKRYAGPSPPVTIRAGSRWTALSLWQEQIALRSADVPAILEATALLVPVQSSGYAALLHDTALLLVLYQSIPVRALPCRMARIIAKLRLALEGLGMAGLGFDLSQLNVLLSVGANRDLPKYSRPNSSLRLPRLSATASCVPYRKLASAKRNTAQCSAGDGRLEIRGHGAALCTLGPAQLAQHTEVVLNLLDGTIATQPPKEKGLAVN
jgi:hypothetical protein